MFYYFFSERFRLHLRCWWRHTRRPSDDSVPSRHRWRHSGHYGCHDNAGWCYRCCQRTVRCRGKVGPAVVE